MITRITFAALLFALSPMQIAAAGDVDVVEARAKLRANGSYQFDVTLRHADTGWDHYADNWEILTLDGELLSRRVLLHPHVGEQPFTRSLSGVRIPEGIKQVRVRGHDMVHGYHGRELVIYLPGR